MSTTQVVAPVGGRAVPLADVPDPVFSAGMVGHGAAVDPPHEVIEAVAPVSGKLLKLMPHAFIVMTPEQVGVLVHLGLDTVQLKGDGFTAHLSQGDDVTAGQVVITYDVASVIAKGLNPIVPVVVMDEREAGNIVPSEAVLEGAQILFRDRPFHCEQIDGSHHPAGRQQDWWSRRRRDCRPAWSQTGGGAGLATGSSPLAIYEELARRSDRGQVSFRQARGFTLDEYVGLPADHPQRYRNVIDEVFVSKVDFAAGAVQGPDGLAADIHAACADTRPRSVTQAVSICRFSVSAPTGTSRSTNPVPHWAHEPGSRR